MTQIKRVTTTHEIKEFFKIFNYWHKEGLVGFVPLFILYRAKEDGQLFVLKKGIQVIGIAWLIPRKRPYEFVQIKTLAIAPEYVEKGHGEKFLRSLIDPLTKAGIDVTTGVLTTNKRAYKLRR